MINIEAAHAAFQDYLKQFDCEDEKIKLKIVHTDGVIRCAREISERMQLSQEDCLLAELIALLHDIGRFEQVRLFDSFEPGVMDHAAFGVQLLFDGESPMIRQFVEEDIWDEIIYKAIARHSAFALQTDDLTEQELLHARMIRDADKLDNCRVKLEESVEVLLGCTKEEAGAQAISPEVWQECMEHSSIHSNKRKSRIDYWVSYIAYFFDINFRATCDIILEEHFAEKIISRIPYTNSETELKMWELYDMVVSDMRRK